MGWKMPLKAEVFPRRWFPKDLGKTTEFHNKHRYLHIKWIPKPSGKKRRILIPNGPLRKAQYLALRYLTEKSGGRWPVTLFTCQTAYKKGASAYKNAAEHEGYKVSVKFDLKNCFDSIPKDDAQAANHTRRFFGGSGPRRPGQKYWPSVMSVQRALEREGIPTDVAAWIADVGTYQGYLYQGSPLSPILCNTVTKQVLCRRMMRLATVYHLPLFNVSCSCGTWQLVVPHKFELDNPAKLWVHGLKSHDNCEMLKHIGNRLSVSSRSKKSPGWTMSIEDMVPRDGETTDDMLLRYAQRAWQPRTPKRIADVLKRLKRYAAIGALLKDGRHSIQHHPLGKTLFTLYCDDGVFSSNNTRLSMIRHILKNVVRDCGFRINTKKGIRIMKGHRRKITGFEVSKPPEGSPPGDRGVRLSWKERDKRYRRVLHYMRTGKKPVDLQTVRSFAGSLEYLRVPNPQAWKKYAREFYELVSKSTSEQEILHIVNRFKEI